MKVLNFLLLAGMVNCISAQQVQRENQGQVMNVVKHEKAIGAPFTQNDYWVYIKSRKHVPGGSAALVRLKMGYLDQVPALDEDREANFIFIYPTPGRIIPTDGLYFWKQDANSAKRLPLLRRRPLEQAYMYCEDGLYRRPVGLGIYEVWDTDRFKDDNRILDYVLTSKTFGGPKKVARMIKEDMKQLTEGDVELVAHRQAELSGGNDFWVSVQPNNDIPMGSMVLVELKNPGVGGVLPGIDTKGVANFHFVYPDRNGRLKSAPLGLYYWNTNNRIRVDKVGTSIALLRHTPKKVGYKYSEDDKSFRNLAGERWSSTFIKYPTLAFVPQKAVTVGTVAAKAKACKAACCRVDGTSRPGKKHCKKARVRTKKVK